MSTHFEQLRYLDFYTLTKLSVILQLVAKNWETKIFLMYTQFHINVHLSKP
jgi:hypothetical protein